MSRILERKMVPALAPLQPIVGQQLFAAIRPSEMPQAGSKHLLREQTLAGSEGLPSILKATSQTELTSEMLCASALQQRISNTSATGGCRPNNHRTWKINKSA
jgi:hypothetical protein